jgi:hypothetical protein
MRGMKIMRAGMREMRILGRARVMRLPFKCLLARSDIL